MQPTLPERIKKIRERINSILNDKREISGHKAQSSKVLLVCVTKTIPLEIMEEITRYLIEENITDIAENRVQDALKKHTILKDKLPLERHLRWHMIGHLQTNKAGVAVKIFDLIQSVDSERLAEHINKSASAIGKIQDILIEVKVSPEATKYGCPPEAVKELAHKISTEFKSLRLLGLMAMAPYFEENAQALSRPYFEKARAIYEENHNYFYPENPYTKNPILSMGMSSDFEAAVRAGANMVRIGSAIFSQ